MSDDYHESAGRRQLVVVVLLSGYLRLLGPLLVDDL
jgi:hypothetical protein